MRNKLLLWMLVFFAVAIIMSSVSAETLKDSFNATTTSYPTCGNGDTNGDFRSWPFYPSSTYNLSSVEIQLARVGDPTGNTISLQLWKANATWVGNESLQNSTTFINGSQVNASAGYQTFKFSGFNAQVSPGLRYVFITTCSGTRTGAGNYIALGMNTSLSYNATYYGTSLPPKIADVTPFQASFWAYTKTISINLASPVNNSILNNTKSIIYNWSTNTSDYNVLYCNLTRDGININSSVVANISTNEFTEILGEGVHDWNVTCNGTTSNTFKFTNRNLSISAVQVIPSYFNATISFTASIESNYTIAYGSTSALGSIIANASRGLSFSRTINSFAYSTLYFFNITIEDADKNISTYSGNFTTEDITANQFSVWFNNQSAKLWFRSSGNFTTKLNYGTTSALSSSISNNTARSSHAIDIPSLSPNTLYYLNITINDSTNTRTYGIYDFTTEKNIVKDIATIRKVAIAKDMEQYTFNTSSYEIKQNLSGTITSCNGNTSVCNWTMSFPMNTSVIRWKNDLIQKLTITETGKGYRPAYSQVVQLTPPIKHYELMEAFDSSGNRLCSNWLLNDTPECGARLYNDKTSFLNPLNSTENQSRNIFLTWGKKAFTLSEYDQLYKNATEQSPFDDGFVSVTGATEICANGLSRSGIKVGKWTNASSAVAPAYSINTKVFYTETCWTQFSQSGSGSSYANIAFNETIRENTTYRFNFSLGLGGVNCAANYCYRKLFQMGFTGASGTVYVGDRNQTCGCYDSTVVTTIRNNLTESTEIIFNISGGTYRIYNAAGTQLSSQDISAAGDNLTLVFYQYNFDSSTISFGGNSMSSYITPIYKDTERIAFTYNSSSDKNSYLNLIKINSSIYPNNLSLSNSTEKFFGAPFDSSDRTINIIKPISEGNNLFYLYSDGKYADTLYFFQPTFSSSVDAVTIDPSQTFITNARLNATITDNGATIKEVNFTLTKPSSVVCVNNLNGTKQGTIWQSSQCLLNETGQYSYSVTSYDDIGTDTKTGVFTITDIITTQPFNITATLEANQPLTFQLNISTDTPELLNFSITENSNQSCFHNVLSAPSTMANSSGSSINVTIQSAANTLCEGSHSFNITLTRSQYEFNRSIGVYVNVSTIFGKLNITNASVWTATLNADANDTTNFTIEIENIGNYNVTNLVAYSETQDQISARLSVRNSSQIIANGSKANITIDLWSYGLGTNSWISTMKLNFTASLYNTTRVTENSFNYNIGTSGSVVVIISGGGGGGGDESKSLNFPDNETLFEVYEPLSGKREVNKLVVEGAIIDFDLVFINYYNGSDIKLTETCVGDFCNSLKKIPDDLSIPAGNKKYITYYVEYPKGEKKDKSFTLTFSAYNREKSVKVTLENRPAFYYVNNALQTILGLREIEKKVTASTEIKGIDVPNYYILIVAAVISGTIMFIIFKTTGDKKVKKLDFVVLVIVPLIAFRIAVAFL